MQLNGYIAILNRRKNEVDEYSRRVQNYQFESGEDTYRSMLTDLIAGEKHVIDKCIPKIAAFARTYVPAPESKHVKDEL